MLDGEVLSLLVVEMAWFRVVVVLAAVETVVVMGRLREVVEGAREERRGEKGGRVL